MVAGCHRTVRSSLLVTTHRLEQTPEPLTKMFGAQALKTDVPFLIIIFGALISQLNLEEFLDFPPAGRGRREEGRGRNFNGG